MIVREHIYEKFTEDSDPIADLNIGGVSLKKLRDDYIKKTEDGLQKLIEDLILGKTISGYFNHIAEWHRDVTGQPYAVHGNNWQTYKIKVGSIGKIPYKINPYSEQEGFNVLDEEHKNTYYIPFSEAGKIHIY